MPKTKDAFAFRDFDEERILQRPWFKRCKEYHTNWDFIIRGEEDSQAVELLYKRIAESLEKNEYASAQYELKEFKNRIEVVNSYMQRIATHIKRLSSYGFKIGEIFMAGKYESAEQIRNKMIRVRDLTEQYSQIIDAIEKLLKNIGKMLTDVEYETTGQYRTTFSTRLREARINAHLSQMQFATQLGMTQGGYRQYENNTREPSLATLARISKILKVSIDWLLGLT